MLAEHPNVLVRLRGEVMETVGPNGKVSSENLKEMRYFRVILNGKRFTMARRLSILICYRDVKVISKCVCVDVLPYVYNQAEKGAAVRGISDAPKEMRFGQPLMGGSRYIPQVIRRFIIFPG